MVCGTILICCCLLIVALIVVIILFNPQAEKKRILKQPNYKQIVIKPKFNDRLNIEAMLIASTTAESNTGRKIGFILERLEEFILKPNYSSIDKSWIS